MNALPDPAAKVQRPSLRDETLARDRLLDWLSAKIHDRVILVLADAGYGKTTLLADFSRRTRLRTLWYRLDEDDRDWIAFLNHLVAAGREHDPGFAPTTAAMLGDMSVGGPTRDAVIDVFLRELPSHRRARRGPDPRRLPPRRRLAGRPAHRARARGPGPGAPVDRVRQSPAADASRWRACARRARSRSSARTISASTPTRRDGCSARRYGRDLEPDVLADVVARTEGWAASLQLVQAALRDRSPAEIRRFVRGLSGADQELYDYLAEEVVGDLPGGPAAVPDADVDPADA